MEAEYADKIQRPLTKRWEGRRGRMFQVLRRGEKERCRTESELVSSKLVCRVAGLRGAFFCLVCPEDLCWPGDREAVWCIQQYGTFSCMAAEDSASTPSLKRTNGL